MNMQVSGIHGPERYSYPPSKQCSRPTRDEIENPSTPEFKYGNQRVTANEFQEQDPIQRKPEDVSDPNDKYKWINKFFCDVTQYAQFFSNLILNGISKAKSDEIKEKVDKAITIAEGASQSGYTNKTAGGIGVKSILLSIFSGIGGIVLKHFDAFPKVQFTFNFLDKLFNQLRNWKQWGTVYSGDKDDLGKNRYEAKKFNVRPVAYIGKAACFTESKIGWVRPALAFFSENVQKLIESLIALPGPVWFRGRTGNEINHEFLPDLLSFIFHKPLSMLGINRSKKVIQEIEERGNLKKGYISKRCKENIGLDAESNKGESVVGKLFEQLGSIFGKTKTYEERAAASDKVNKLISPFVGLYGFFTLLVGVPLKSGLNYFGIENKYLDSFCQSGIASQHLRYIFMLMLPEQFRNKALQYDPNSPELNKLKSGRNKLFAAGLTTCLLNIILVPLKLFKPENKYLKTSMSVLNELGEKGVGLYFSRRRELMGKKDKLDFPEQYNDDGTPKIISDKLEELEKAGKKVSEPSVNGALHKTTAAPTATDPK